jgi:hypothetical protein
MMTRAPSAGVFAAVSVVFIAAVSSAYGQPPPPLFRHHHHGTYKNDQGIEVIDATPQSPPLETDDPNVPDPHEWEINLTTLADLSSASQRVDLLLVDANVGFLPAIAGQRVPTQLKFEFPMSGARTAGDRYNFGVGAAKAGVKFNFYADDRLGLSVSIYPQLEFVLPPGNAVKKDLAEPGQRVILPLLISKNFPFGMVVGNAGIETPLHDPDGDFSVPVSLAFGRAVTRKLAAMVEIRGESALTPGAHRLMFVNAGAMRTVGHVLVYGNWGESLASGDEITHSYLGVGMKMLVRPGDSR